MKDPELKDREMTTEAWTALFNRVDSKYKNLRFKQVHQGFEYNPKGLL